MQERCELTWTEFLTLRTMMLMSFLKNSHTSSFSTVFELSLSNICHTAIKCQQKRTSASGARTRQCLGLGSHAST